MNTNNSYRWIGNMLKQEREKLNLSQQEVADYVKVSKSAISRWESGEVGNMGRSKIVLLAEALNISPVAIVTGENYQANEDLTNSILIPVYGSIPAGIPLEAIEDIQGHVDIPANWLKGNKEYIALEVRGDSMYPKYLDGDLVIILLQSDCDSHQDCACYVNGFNATLKTVVKGTDTIELRPYNPNYPPKTYSHPGEVCILGIVKELRRRL